MTSMNDESLRDEIHKLLEPRVLLAEEHFYRLIEQSRTALKVWKGIHALEKGGLMSNDRMSEFKDSLEDSVMNGDEAMLTALQKDVMIECGARRLNIEDIRVLETGGGSFRGIGYGNGSVGREVEARSSVLEELDAVGKGTNRLLNFDVERRMLEQKARIPLKVGTEPGVPVWKRLFCVNRYTGERATVAEKAFYISLLAWTLAFASCFVGLLLLTRAYVQANQGRLLQTDLLPVESRTMPEFAWCHIADNIPSFFDPIESKYPGEPLFGASTFRDVEVPRSQVFYPHTRDLFKEVIVAEGSAEEKAACAQRLRKFDVKVFKEGQARGSDVPRCRSCLQLKKGRTLVSTNPAARPQASSNTGFVFQFSSSRMLSVCLRLDFRTESVGIVRAGLAELTRHLKDMERQGILDLSETEPKDFEIGTEGIINLFERMRIRCGDRQNASFYTFLCNAMFFSGYFYPIVDKKQSWKYIRSNDSFIPVGSNFSYFKSRGRISNRGGGEPLAQQETIPPAFFKRKSEDSFCFGPGGGSPQQRSRPRRKPVRESALAVENVFVPPFSPLVTMYAARRESENSSGVRANSEDLLAYISAERSTGLRLRSETDTLGREHITPREIAGVALSRLLDTERSTSTGYFRYQVYVSFENFLRESFAVRSTFTTPEFIADVLNILGIFLGFSVIAALTIPPSLFLIQSTTRTGT